MPRTRSEEKRTRILRAAEDLFTGRRFHEVTLDEVAAAAKVSKGTLYLYFSDKDDLFFHTATAGFDDLCRILRDEVPAAGALPDRLELAAVKVSDFFRARKPLLRMIMAEDSRMPWFQSPLKERWREKRSELRSTLASILSAGRERLRGDFCGETLAGFFLGMLRSRNQDLSDSPKGELELGKLVDLFLHGASPAPGSGKGRPAARFRRPRRRVRPGAKAAAGRKT